MLIEKLKERIQYAYNSMGSEMDHKIFFDVDFKELWLRFESTGSYVSSVLIYKGCRSEKSKFEINRILIGSNKLSLDIICEKVIQEIKNNYNIDSTNTVVSQPKIIIETIMNSYIKPKRKRLSEKSKSNKKQKSKSISNTLDVLNSLDIKKPIKINLKEPKPTIELEPIKQFDKIKATTPEEIKLANKEREIFSNPNMWKYDL